MALGAVQKALEYRSAGCCQWPKGREPPCATLTKHSDRAAIHNDGGVDEKARSYQSRWGLPSRNAHRTAGIYRRLHLTEGLAAALCAVEHIALIREVFALSARHCSASRLVESERRCQGKSRMPSGPGEKIVVAAPTRRHVQLVACRNASAQTNTFATNRSQRDRALSIQLCYGIRRMASSMEYP